METDTMQQIAVMLFIVEKSKRLHEPGWENVQKFLSTLFVYWVEIGGKILILITV